MTRSNFLHNLTLGLVNASWSTRQRSQRSTFKWSQQHKDSFQEKFWILLNKLVITLRISLSCYMCHICIMSVDKQFCSHASSQWTIMKVNFQRRCFKNTLVRMLDLDYSDVDLEPKEINGSQTNSHFCVQNKHCTDAKTYINCSPWTWDAKLLQVRKKSFIDHTHRCALRKGLNKV